MKKPIFIFSSGELHREGNTLVLVKEERDKRFVPVTSVSELYIFGELTINKKLLEFLSSYEILVHFFNYYGFYVGSYFPRSHYNSGYVVIKQAEHYLDFNKRLSLAKKFVEGALDNMQRVLHYYILRGLELYQEEDAIKYFRRCVSGVMDIESLMGLEGNAKQTYYEAFNKIIDDDSFKYSKRTRRPPENRFDCLMSFLNSLLYVSILREIYMTHLDPRIGFLHESNFRSFSLNLDVAEVFKPIIVDRLIFSLLNRRMMDDGCFLKELEGVFLNERGKKIVVGEFERKMETTVTLKHIRRKVSYRRLIRIELYKLEKHLIGESEYRPLRAEW